MRIFEDDEPIECDACGEMIIPDDSYMEIKHNKNTYCCCNSEECMGKILFNIFGDLFREKFLQTGIEKAFSYADMYEDD